jgi:co-chaperonin GroES (HSP10)
MSKKKFIYPLRNFILVKPIEVVTPKYEGLIMPDSVENGNLKKVEIVQLGTESMPDTLNIGSVIVVPSTLRNEIFVNGVKHYLVHIEEVLALEA